jgi:heat shock protein HtpX
MKTEASSLPSRKWSIVALGTAGMATVILSFLLAIVVALACMALPYVMFGLVQGSSMLFARALLSAFGVVAGFTILRSLIPKKEDVKINGVLVDLGKEKRLANEIQAISSAMQEPMPTEVYLMGDANAFVSEVGGGILAGKRRVMGLGLPLLQMLSIAEFRAVLAHEFGHYYAGDTRLGPWVYNTRKSITRAYENLGRNSEVMRFLRRWAIVHAVFLVLMGAMRMYWKVFMYITQAISRQQEFRSDELACHIAGSQALIDGLEQIRKCQPALNSYWNAVVLPVAMGGFQPALADGFGRYMHTPQIEAATRNFLTEESKKEKPSALDTHPPLSKRVERAQRYNLPLPAAEDTALDTSLPMVSLIDGLPELEASMLKRFVPALKEKELKQVDWEAIGREVYVPSWRKQIVQFSSVLTVKTLADLPALVAEPKPLALLILNPPKGQLTYEQREARARDVLFMTFALGLVDNGWLVRSQPGVMYFERDDKKIEPGKVISELKSGKMTAGAWLTFQVENAIGNWPLTLQETLQPTQ